MTTALSLPGFVARGKRALRLHNPCLQLHDEHRRMSLRTNARETLSQYPAAHGPVAHTPESPMGADTSPICLSSTEADWANADAGRMLMRVQ